MIYDRKIAIKQISPYLDLLTDKIVRILNGIIGFLIMSRALDQDQFGLFVVTTSWLGILAVIAGNGFANHTTRLASRHRHQQDKILNTMISTAQRASVVLVVVSIAIFQLYPVQQILFGTPIVLIFIPWLMLESRLYADQKTFYIRNITLIYIGISVALKLTFISLSFISNAALALIIGWDISGYAIILRLFFGVNKNINYQPKTYLKSFKRPPIIKTGLLFLLTSLVGLIFVRSDLIMLGALETKSQVAIYSVGSKITELATIFSTVVSLVIYPTIAKSSRGREKKLVVIKYLGFATLFSLALIPIIYFSADSIIDVFFSEKYQDSSMIAQLLSITLPFIYVGTVFQKYLSTEGLQNKILSVTIIACSTNIILNLVLIPKFGASGAAYATIFAQAIVTLGIFIYTEPRRKICSLFSRQIY